MPGEKKISSSPFPTCSNFCFLLHPSLLKWFPVTNCSNCQNQTLRPGTPQAEAASSLPASTRHCAAPGRQLHSPSPQTSSAAHRSPPPSSSASGPSSGFPEHHPWYSHVLQHILQAWEDENLPFYSSEGCGCLFVLISHFSISPILRPFVQGVGSLL